MNRKVSMDFMVSWWSTLTDEEKSALSDSSAETKAFLAERARWIAENTFVIPLSDEEATQLLIQWKGYTEEQAKAKIRVWRIYAQKMGYTGPIVWKIKAGFGRLFENIETDRGLGGLHGFEEVPADKALVAESRDPRRGDDDGVRSRVLYAGDVLGDARGRAVGDLRGDVES